MTAPNFEEKFHILRLPKPLAEIAKDRRLTEAELLARLEPLKKKLFDVPGQARAAVPRHEDHRAWNGQMIAGYAKAGEVFENPEYVKAAANAADFLLAKMRDKDGRLLRLYAAAPGEKPAARGTAFLDDYAFLVHGLLNLHDATGEKKWLDAAKALTDLAIKFHGDGDRGGFFFTPSDGEKLFARAKDGYDGVQPSGNSQMARNLLRLSVKLKDDKYRALSEKTIKQFAMTLRMQPGSVPTMALCLDEFIAAGGSSANPTAKADAPTKPKDSADVVKAKLTVGGEKDGKRKVIVSLTVAAGWHIYANVVSNETLLDSRTEMTLYVDGKVQKTAILYPNGKPIKDSVSDMYNVYEGTVELSATVAASQSAKIEARVKVIACNDRSCLLPSTIMVK